MNSTLSDWRNLGPCQAIRTSQVKTAGSECTEFWEAFRPRFYFPRQHLMLILGSRQSETTLRSPSCLHIMPAQWIALLGKRDEPTDAVEEYCRFLADALRPAQISLEMLRLRWPQTGWRSSLRELQGRFDATNIQWFLLQYTALSWSRRGFPLRVLQVIKSLKTSGSRCAIVFHDMQPYEGSRVVDRVRRAVQLYTMRTALKMVDLAVFTVPPENIDWIPRDIKRSVSIPVGANLPSPEKAWSKSGSTTKSSPTVAIFSFTDGSARSGELEVIAQALRYARSGLPSLRADLLGRNSQASGQALTEKLAGADVEIEVHGLLAAEDVVRVMGASDVLLFVRNEISSRRGSAIAGIACGLPVIAQEGSETAPPITEAGVVLVSAQNPSEFGPALLRVLTDHTYRASLAERSRNAQERYFSWSAIAAQYAKALRESASDSQS